MALTKSVSYMHKSQIEQMHYPDSYELTTSYVGSFAESFASIYQSRHYRLFYQFDVTEILKYEINSITLSFKIDEIRATEEAKQEPSITIWGGESDLRPNRTWNSPKFFQTKDFGTKTSLVLGSVTMPVTMYSLQTSGDTSYLTFGFFGLPPHEINGGGKSEAYVKVSDATLVFDLEPIPPLAPVFTKPTVAQNPRLSIDFAWTHKPTISDAQKAWELQVWQDNVAPKIYTGKAENKYTLPANTLTLLTPVKFKARTSGLVGGWGPYAESSISLVLNPPKAPTNIYPRTTQNPNRVITFSWNHNNDLYTDTQTGWELVVTQNATTKTYTGTIENRYEMAAGTFAKGNITFKIRTKSALGDWGPYAENTILLDINPANPPTFLAPVGSPNPNRAIVFSWKHNAVDSGDTQTAWELEVWQGANVKKYSANDQANTVTVPAKTFTTGALNYKARTKTLYNDWTNYTTASITLAITPPGKPINLLPTLPQNPRGSIEFSWWHVAGQADDPQNAWELAIKQGTATIKTVTGTTENKYVLPANTITVYSPITMTVRTSSLYSGYGTTSSQTITIRSTPPNKPLLRFPVGIPLAGADGITLQWLYSSDYDTTWTKFDYQYRINGQAWITGTTVMQSATTQGIDYASTVEWQVRAYGELGDVGEWSDIVQFQTIGRPPTPVITGVTNSNRPVISFSAKDILSFEISVLDDKEIEIYNSKNVLFTAFNYQLTELLANGRYVARIRYSSLYGERSEWGIRPFIIDRTPLTPIKLRISNNQDLSNTLFLSNGTKTKYIYRNGVRIAKTTSNSWTDYGAEVQRENIYHVVNVDTDWNFAISSNARNILDFKHTTIASVNNLNEPLLLVYQINNMPSKSMAIEQEKKLTKITGRKHPVIEFGEHISQTFEFSFHVTEEEKNRLIYLTNITDILLLRDWRYGNFYGDITSIANIEAFKNGFNMSFGFTVLDYNEVIPL